MRYRAPLGAAMRFGDTPGLRYGDRVVVTVENVTAGATFVAGVGRQRFVVVLDGTDQTVTVPGATITREASHAE